MRTFRVRRVVAVAMTIFAVCAVVSAQTSGRAAAPRPERSRTGAQVSAKPVLVVQISDAHVGITENPLTHEKIDAIENLKRIAAKVREMRPDAVFVTGDIGDSSDGWMPAIRALAETHAPIYYLPGNHDISSGADVEKYRARFGMDYYRVRIRHVQFYCIDSQLLGNYTHFNATQAEPIAPETQEYAERMFEYLGKEVDALKVEEHTSPVRIAVQHVPISNDGHAPDAKPYWTTQEPGRSREIEVLKRLGVQHVIAGHWHKFETFDTDGFTQHVGPSAGFAAAKVPLGFVVYRISVNGVVDAEFVELPAADAKTASAKK